MITALVPFLGNKWAKLGIEAALVGALVLGIRAYFLAEGKRNGRDEAAQSQQQDLERARQQDRRDMQSVIDKTNGTLADAEKQHRAADEALQRLAGILGDLARQRRAGESKVAAIADSDLHGYVLGALNLRAIGDKSPGYLPVEERALAGCVTQYPLCQKQVETEKEKLALEQKNTAASDQVGTARLEAIKAKDAYIGQLEAKFAALYNLHPPKFRSPRCLWLWRCGTRKVSGPSVSAPEVKHE
jgi:hypothetical protein